MQVRHALDRWVEDVTENLHGRLDKGHEWTEKKLGEVQEMLDGGKTRLCETMDRILRS